MQEIKVKKVLFTKIGQEESENYDKFEKIIKDRKINVLQVEAGKIINIDKCIKY